MKFQKSWQNLKEGQRMDRLCSALAKKYAHLLNDESIDDRVKYDEIVTEMFEVGKIGSTSCELFHLYTDKHYRPVVAPPDILAHLRPGDVFLMVIGKTKRAWHVTYMSQPYEEMTFEVEDTQDEDGHWSARKLQDECAASLRSEN